MLRIDCGAHTSRSTTVQVAAGGARQSAQLWRSMLRIDCAALLGPGSRRVSRFVRFALYAPTDAASQIFGCALRALTPDTALLAATDSLPAGHRLPLRHHYGILETAERRRCRKAAFGHPACHPERSEGSRLRQSEIPRFQLGMTPRCPDAP